MMKDTGKNPRPARRKANENFHEGKPYKAVAVILDDEEDESGKKKIEEVELKSEKQKKRPQPPKKKRHDGEEENLERWLVSYADFITLLFAFFVTMYSISRVDQEKLTSAARSLRQALSATPAAHALAPPLDSGKTPLPVGPAVDGDPGDGERMFLETLAREIRAEIGKVSSSAEQIEYIIGEGELVVRVPDCLFFASGQASIRPEVAPILDALGRSLVKIQNPISVEGHTDDVPISTPRFESNWELSSARATEIIRYLLTHFQFDPYRLSAAGYAEFRPVADNATAEGRRKNRRVDLVILTANRVER